MQGKIPYTFSAQIWKHPSPGGWHFISLPQEIALEIRELMGYREEGWGRLAATAHIRGQLWETAIWYDTQKGTYLLPVKSVIRRRESLKAGQIVEVTIWL